MKLLNENIVASIMGMGDMPIDLCVICDEPLDHQDAGFCVDCGGAFHWSSCGNWGENDHKCNICGGFDDEDE